MRAALLSCGPSLIEYVPNGHDVVIGVNDAVDRFACDWCVGLDLHLYTYISPVRDDMLYLTQSDARRVHGFRGMDIGQLRLEGVERHLWAGYSSTAALVLAKTLRATEVDVYGVDMVGAFDHRGVKAEWRNPERWDRERAKWEVARAGVEALGVEVHGAEHIHA